MLIVTKMFGELLYQDTKWSYLKILHIWLQSQSLVNMSKWLDGRF